jgi:hypothetical protein
MASRFKARDEFISGLTMTIAFGTIWLIFGSNFWIFPMVFAGLIPCVRGGIRFFSSRSLSSRDPKKLIQQKNTGSLERQILSVAKTENGRVTPAVIALNSNVTLEEAEKTLEDMVKRGYASMEVRDSGTVEYVFPEFMP